MNKFIGVLGKIMRKMKCIKITSLLAVLTCVVVYGTTPQVDTGESTMLYEETDVLNSGTRGYSRFRIPAMIISTKGTVVAFFEARKGEGKDFDEIDLVMTRSTDSGKTWEEISVLADITTDSLGNPCPVFDRDTETIHLLFTDKTTDKVYYMKSMDEGVNWSDYKDITDQVRGTPEGRCTPNPGHGIQFSNGRLLFPARERKNSAYAIYSEDHGKTFASGGFIGKGSNESMAVERSDGSVYMTLRTSSENNRKAYAISDDMGMTWSEIKEDPALVTPRCQSSILRLTDERHHGKNRILYCNPNSVKRGENFTNRDRQNLTVRLSYDECNTWPVSKQIFKEFSAYSDMIVLPDMTIGLIYEWGGNRDERAEHYLGIKFARFNLEWLTDGADSIANTQK